MTHTRRFQPRFAIMTAALVGLTLFAGACGSSEPKAAGPSSTTAATPGPNDSAYCKTARQWLVHEFNGTGDTVADDPAAFGKYMREYLAFLVTANGQAPAELRHHWTAGYAFLITKLKPLFDKYDYDIERIKTEGTPAELAIGQRADAGPNEKEDAGQSAVHAYENKVCDTGQPEAADVSFADATPNQAYCNTVHQGDELTQSVAAKKWSVDAVRALVTGREYAALSKKAKETAPTEIKADVIADSDWSTMQQVDVLEKFGYDVRKLFLEGTQADRQTFQKSDPAIADHFARTLAYEEQLCGDGDE
jgi:hypothetical protein